jgi:hypothetical protein
MISSEIKKVQYSYVVIHGFRKMDVANPGNTLPFTHVILGHVTE